MKTAFINNILKSSVKVKRYFMIEFEIRVNVIIFDHEIDNNR